VSLFPFLSILVCVIGILTLMIVASSLGDMGKKPDPALVEQTNRYKELRQQIAADQKEIAGLQTKLEGSEIGEARVQAIQKDYEQLRALVESQSALQERVARTAELAQLRDSLKIRQEQLLQEQKAREQLAIDLDKEIEAKGKPPEATVAIRPVGSGRDMIPFFVECADAGIVLYEGETPKRIRTADIGVDPDFLALLEKVGENEKGILIFLMRDNGLGTFNAAKGVADQRGVRTGKLPVIGQGNIDLTSVQKRQRRPRERQ
jgi:hypothetical protein